MALHSRALITLILLSLAGTPATNAGDGFSGDGTRTECKDDIAVIPEKLLEQKKKEVEAWRKAALSSATKDTPGVIGALTSAQGLQTIAVAEGIKTSEQVLALQEISSRYALESIGKTRTLEMLERMLVNQKLTSGEAAEFFVLGTMPESSRLRMLTSAKGAFELAEKVSATTDARLARTTLKVAQSRALALADQAAKERIMATRASAEESKKIIRSYRDFVAGRSSAVTFAASEIDGKLTAEQEQLSNMIRTQARTTAKEIGKATVEGRKVVSAVTQLDLMSALRDLPGVSAAIEANDPTMAKLIALRREKEIGTILLKYHVEDMPDLASGRQGIDQLELRREAIYKETRQLAEKLAKAKGKDVSKVEEELVNFVRQSDHIDDANVLTRYADPKSLKTALEQYKTGKITTAIPFSEGDPTKLGKEMLKVTQGSITKITAADFLKELGKGLAKVGNGLMVVDVLSMDGSEGKIKGYTKNPDGVFCSMITDDPRLLLDLSSAPPYFFGNGKADVSPASRMATVCTMIGRNPQCWKNAKTALFERVLPEQFARKAMDTVNKDMPVGLVSFGASCRSPAGSSTAPGEHPSMPAALGDNTVARTLIRGVTKLPEWADEASTSPALCDCCVLPGADDKVSGGLRKSLPSEGISAPGGSANGSAKKKTAAEAR